MNTSIFNRTTILGIALCTGLGLLATISISDRANAQGPRPGVGGGPPAALKWQSDNGNIFVMGANVGINTDSPAARLHVEEPEDGLAIWFPGLRIYNNDTSPNIAGGYSGNVLFMKGGLSGATIAGGGGPSVPNFVFTDYGTISGGRGNTINGIGATISGGSDNFAASFVATVGGGSNNRATSQLATVAGGGSNEASGSESTVGGGRFNEALEEGSTIAGGSFNLATGASSTVGGGRDNAAEGAYATISGGEINEAAGQHSAIGGGRQHSASGPYATIAGGNNHTASGDRATVGGGGGNFATELGATVAGGTDNRAMAEHAFVAGGRSNSAHADYSFAAGRRARANHPGSFVWGDSTGSFAESSANNQVTFHSVGGYRIFTNAGFSAGVTLAPGGSAWAAVSDRNAKENFEEVDTREVLNRISAMPILLWNYKSQDATIRHMGPMAQDFWAAFALGEDELRINTINADGVALAAIQGLHEIVMEKDAQIADLQNALDAQTLRTTQLEANVFELQQAVNSLLNLIEGNQR